MHILRFHFQKCNFNCFRSQNKVKLFLSVICDIEILKIGRSADRVLSKLHLLHCNVTHFFMCSSSWIKLFLNIFISSSPSKMWLKYGEDELLILHDLSNGQVMEMCMSGNQVYNFRYKSHVSYFIPIPICNLFSNEQLSYVTCSKNLYF